VRFLVSEVPLYSLYPTHTTASVEILAAPAKTLRFRVQGLKGGVGGLGLRLWGLGFQVLGLGSRVGVLRAPN